MLFPFHSIFLKRLMLSFQRLYTLKKSSFSVALSQTLNSKLTPEGGDGAREEAQAEEEDDLVHVRVCPLMRCGDTGTISGGHIIRVGDRVT